MTGGPGIADLRASLGFGAAEEALIRSSAAKLTPEVERWVEQFYARLMLDPVAMALLDDESRVLRLKRSLVAWFLEIFSLPFDEGYERARRDIGIVHVRIGMPLYLMVTAMNGIRRDIGLSATSIWGHDPAHAHRLTDAFSKVLDLELALMLEGYRRRQRELEQESYVALQAEGFAVRLVDRLVERVDAALCYAALLRAAGDADRDAWASRLTHVLRGCLLEGAQAPPPQRGSVRRQRLQARDVCQRAAGNVSLSAHAGLEIDVEPPTLALRADPERLQRALEVLLQGLANLERGAVRVLVRSRSGWVDFDVLLEGDGGKGLGSVEDLGARGIDVSTCDYVARLHGGALAPVADGTGRTVGLRLSVPSPETGEADADADQPEDPQGTAV